MELRHLRYFSAVGECLSYRKASERLNVSRSALSMQVKDLESELGVQLLERNTATVRLTDAGRQLLDDSREILGRVEEAATRAREAAIGKLGRVVVGGGGPLSHMFLPPTLRAYRQQFPDIDVSLRDGDMLDNLTALRAREQDVSFLVATHLPADENLAHRRVLRCSIKLVVGSQHRLADADVVSAADLVHESFLAVGEARTSPHSNFIREAFRVRGFRVGQPRTVGSFDSLMALVEGDQGVSLVPELTERLRYGDLRFIRLLETAADLRFELLAVWRKDERSPAVRNFLRQLALVTREGADDSDPKPGKVGSEGLF